MANDNVQTKEPPASAKLAEELEALHERVQRMERLLHGVESVVGTIRYDAHLSFTPANDERTDAHRRAYQMIEFISEQCERWRKDESDLDFPSDDLWELWERAKDGRLIRYGKLTPESVEA